MKKRATKYLNALRTNLAKYNEASGINPIALNCLKKQLKGLQIIGNSNQKTYSGINLFDSSMHISDYDVTSSVIETGIRVNASATSTYSSAIYGPFSVKGGSDYIFTSDITVHPSGETPMSGVVLIMEYDSENRNTRERQSTVISSDGHYTIAFTTNASTVNVRIRFYVSYGVAADVGSYYDFNYLMFCGGKAVPGYEPYVGGAPSPSTAYPQSIVTPTDGGLTITAISSFGSSMLTIPSTVTIGEETLDLPLAKISDVADQLKIERGRVLYLKKIGKIAGYNGEEINTPYMSSTGGLTTGATVYYVLPVEEEIDITQTTVGQNIKNYCLPNGSCNIYTSGGVQVSYFKIKYAEEM